jgi:hypothetical protein
LVITVLLAAAIVCCGRARFYSRRLRQQRLEQRGQLGPQVGPKVYDPWRWLE